MKEKARINKRSRWSAFERPDGTFDFEALTDAQKEELYQECESLTPLDVRPLTPAQRRLHARARRRGRPRKGAGAEIVSLSIEKSLLRQAERLAKSQGLSRSDLFARGIRVLLAVEAA